MEFEDLERDEQSSESKLKLFFGLLVVLLLTVSFLSLNQNSEQRLRLPQADTEKFTSNFTNNNTIKRNRTKIIQLVSNDTSQMTDEEWIFHKQATEEFYVDGLTGDNVNGFPKLIVPNIIHYILFQDHVLSFVHFISIMSVLRNQKPDKIMIHCDCDQLEGLYWDRLLTEDFGNTSLIMRRIKYPEGVFGKKFSPGWRLWHASDATRPRILMEFGGFYLDRDVYVVKSLDEFRRFEMTLVMESNQMASGIQIAHKNARFLKLYLNLYKEYDGNSWTKNSGYLPTVRIINKYPHLVHLIRNNEFGVKPTTCVMLFQDNSKTWQNDYYMIHLFIRGNSAAHDGWCLDGRRPVELKEFNEVNIKKSNVTFGQIARLIFYNTTDWVV